MFNMTGFLLLLLSIGCVSTGRYMGTTSAPMSQDQQRKSRISWSVTEQSRDSDDNKTGVLLLESVCSKRTIIFKETPSGISFVGTSDDRIPGQESLAEGISCGSVLNYRKITDLPEGPIKVHIVCEPVQPWVKRFGSMHYFDYPKPGIYEFTVKREDIDGPMVELPPLACGHGPALAH